MPVNLALLDRNDLLSVHGVRLGVAEAAIKKPGRKDLLVIALESGANVAGVFTQNRFCAAPVVIARERLRANHGTRVLVVNTGNANAGTGADGLRRTHEVCLETAKILGCDPEQVLPFSTGVIMEPLPVERIVAGLPRCMDDLREDNWYDAAHAIMTTDTVAKAASRRIDIDGLSVTLTGIAKGAGMIHPDMATMLAFIATDARVSQPQLQALASGAAARSFNCITIDGDTSTNDAFMLIASGTAKMPEITDAASVAFRKLQQAMTETSIQLAQAIVRDGEGATKFITVQVEQGRDEQECRAIAFSIAHSPLVKTAFFASDPNLGRILAAIGKVDVAGMNVHDVALYLDDVLVAEGGRRTASYAEADGRRVLSQAEITIRVLLNRGDASATIWTCDLSHDYVSINADYRS